MLGMVPGNGHPYSWSAIVNGYDRAAMASCPYPVIPAYLGAQPPGEVRVPGARVTHIWTDDPADAPRVARASLIPHVLARAEDAIGQVDAAFIASGDGYDHVARARPFVEAGLPVFVDKPLALTVEGLRTFLAWRKAGARILSSSGLRFAPALDPLLADRSSLGELRWIAALSCKDWENYAVHALEPVFRVLGAGFLSARLESRPGLETAHLLHRSGVQITLPVIADGGVALGTLHLAGTGGQATLKLTDTYGAFRRQVVSFIDYVRAGGPDPYPFSDTIEIMAVLMAALRSRESGSRRVDISEILSDLG